MTSRDIIVQIMLLFSVMAVAYIMLVRPQLKRLTDHQRFLASLKLGDRVVTRGGLIGEIVQIDGDNVVQLDLSKSVRVMALRSSIDERFRG